MRAKTSILVAALCFILVAPATALPQSIESRPRRVSSAQELDARPVAYRANNSLTGGAATASLESSVHREGLQFYFEIRNGGLEKLASAAEALGPMTKLLASGPMKVSTDELTGFVVRHLGALASARVAIAGYGANGMAVLIEAARDSDAQQLKAGVAQLLGASKAVAKAVEVDVNVRDRVVIAGPRAIASMLASDKGAASVASDPEFMRAQARFLNDPFFLYADLASMPIGLPGGGDGANAAYTAGALAALNSRPYAIAMGGSLEGDSVTLRALMLYSSNQSAGPLAGLISALTYAAGQGRPVAANFAAADADLFVDVMIDWGKLYEAIESLSGMISGLQSNAEPQSGGAQSADVFAMAEKSLGFSIKNDLLPTLGNELAISLTGLDRLLVPASKSASKAGRSSASLAPRFMLMVALKDSARFEKLVGAMIDKSSGARNKHARLAYRGATISYSKDVAYSISGGFFILGGSPSDIRRALDARALGTSLASAAEFRAAVGSSDQAMMQAYVSPGMSNKLYELISAEVARSSGRSKGMAGNAAQTRSAIGVTMSPDSDGLMMEMRVPTNITFMALAAVATGKPAPSVISSAPASGVGIPRPTAPAARARAADGRRIPKMTDEDVVRRRP